MKTRGYLVVLLFLLCIFPKTVYATEKTYDDLINDDNDINILEENKIQEEDTLPIIEATSFSSSKDTKINLTDKVSILNSSDSTYTINFETTTPSGIILTTSSINPTEIGTYYVKISINKYNLEKTIEINVYDKLLTDESTVEASGDFVETTVTTPDEKVYDHSFSGEDYELTYENTDDYQSLNFSVNNEKDETIYIVYVDNEELYKYYLSNNGEVKSLKLNISGKIITIKVIGKGNILTPHFNKVKNIYKITYENDQNSINYESEDTNYILDNNTFEKTGYTFNGWKVDNDIYNPGDKITLTDDITISATWNLSLYEVKYYLDNDTFILRTYSILNQTLFIPTLAGYNFLGWFDEYNNKITSLTTGNLILYAKWEKPSPIKTTFVPAKLKYIPSTSEHTSSDNKKIDQDSSTSNPEIITIPTSFNSKNIELNYYIIFGALLLLISYLLIKLRILNQKE